MHRGLSQAEIVWALVEQSGFLLRVGLCPLCAHEVYPIAVNPTALDADGQLLETRQCEIPCEGCGALVELILKLPWA